MRLYRRDGTLLRESSAETMRGLMEEAVRDGASLDGASLDGASLVGASLDGARLDGASLDGASLVGASLVGARLDGASLDGASLVGASLVGASLADAYRLSLSGSRHPLRATRSGLVAIGCRVLTLDQWRAQGAAVAREENYDDAAQTEYWGLLDVVEAWIKATGGAR